MFIALFLMIFGARSHIPCVKEGMVDRVTKVRRTTKGQEIEMIMQIMTSKLIIVVASASRWLGVRWNLFQQSPPTSFAFSRILFVFANGFVKSPIGRIFKYYTRYFS